MDLDAVEACSFGVLGADALGRDDAGELGGLQGPRRHELALRPELADIAFGRDGAWGHGQRAAQGGAHAANALPTGRPADANALPVHDGLKQRQPGEHDQQRGGRLRGVLGVSVRLGRVSGSRNAGSNGGGLRGGRRVSGVAFRVELRRGSRCRARSARAASAARQWCKRSNFAIGSGPR